MRHRLRDGAPAAGRVRRHLAVRVRMVDEASRLKVGYGQHEDTFMGPVISASHRNRVRGYIDEGERTGAKVLLDGRDIRVDACPEGHRMGPAILAGAFTPAVLGALFWKGTTRAGAIAGMITGFVVTVGWTLLFEADFYELYEMIPGFFAGLAATIAVWLFTTPPTVRVGSSRACAARSATRSGSQDARRGGQEPRPVPQEA